MERAQREGADATDLSVTLYGCCDIAADERYRLARVFCEVLEAVLGSTEQVVALQAAYNRIINQFSEMSLPLTVMGEEAVIIDRWSSAYQAAFDSAFVAVFGHLHAIPEGAHFEIDS